MRKLTAAMNFVVALTGLVWCIGVLLVQLIVLPIDFCWDRAQKRFPSLRWIGNLGSKFRRSTGAKLETLRARLRSLPGQAFVAILLALAVGLGSFLQWRKQQPQRKLARAERRQEAIRSVKAHIPEMVSVPTMRLASVAGVALVLVAGVLSNLGTTVLHGKHDTTTKKEQHAEAEVGERV